MDFRNTTGLNDARLFSLLLRHTAPYRHDDLRVRVRYSRGADYSGTFFINEARIHVNLGRRNRYPYILNTSIAKAQTTERGWKREICQLLLGDAYQLVLFVYLHELYHHLVKAAGRSQRRKEAMCDRFATRVLVDDHNCRLQTKSGLPVERRSWDFKDLEAFVASSPVERQMHLPLLGNLLVR